MDQPQPLKGKVAVVTGAGRRVGQAIALELARAGASLVAHYGQSAAGAAATAREARESGVDAEPMAADLARPAEIARLFDTVRARFGRVDLLVNSAAVFERIAIADLTVEAWDRMQAINLRAPFLCVQAALPLMPDGGQIVNIVDIGGLVAAWPHHAHYISAKAGLAMLTRALALELAPRLRVNGVAPGTVIFGENTPDAEKARLTARIPLGRIGAPEDIARTVRFLATGPEFITGQIFAVDGGRSVNTGGV